MPPRVKREYDENDWWAQALILSYGIIRDQEESEEKNSRHESLVKALGQMMGAKKIGG